MQSAVQKLVCFVKVQLYDLQTVQNLKEYATAK